MQINIDPASFTNFLTGHKTYLALLGGAAVIALNHFGYIPPGYTNLDPANWINDEFKLLIAATGRSALASLPPLTAQHVVAAQKKAVAEGTLPGLTMTANAVGGAGGA